MEGRQSTTIVAINEEAYGVELNRATIKHEESKMKLRPHPAKYTNCLIPEINKLLGRAEYILDPFAGTGKIFSLGNHLKIKAVELEPEWAAYDKRIILGNALSLPFEGETFDGVVTSPCYGNRMADSFNAKDSTKRNTYHHALGRKPSEGSAAILQWGPGYKEFHEKAWKEVRRVLKNNGVFILNIKNHIRNGVEQDVTQWHINCLVELGFLYSAHEKVKTPSNRFGANGSKRISYESLVKFVKK